MKGRLLTVEGLDGSGKATQANLLCDFLKEQGITVREVSFPDYDHSSSALVKMYLNGEFGKKPESPAGRRGMGCCRQVHDVQHDLSGYQTPAG